MLKILMLKNTNTSTLGASRGVHNKSLNLQLLSVTWQRAHSKDGVRVIAISAPGQGHIYLSSKSGS